MQATAMSRKTMKQVSTSMAQAEVAQVAAQEEVLAAEDLTVLTSK